MSISDPLATEDGDRGVDEIAVAMATPEFRQDPYPVYARMRLEHPVYRSEQGIWYVTRYADVEAALHDLRLSNDRDRMTRALAAGEEDFERLSRLTGRLGRVVTNTDPPDHTRLRRIVNKAFTARLVHGFRPLIQSTVDELLDAATPTMDLMASLAVPLPVTVICHLFGVPSEDEELVSTWLHELDDPVADESRDRVELIEQLYAYVAELIARRRVDRGEDVTSALVSAQERGEQLADDELLATCFILLTAGGETTSNLIGNGAHALLRHPDQLRRLRDDPTLLRLAMDELLRYDTPTQAIMRVVAGPAEVGGRTMADGDLVYLVLGATNRDPERFVDPDCLRLGRADNRYLSFGSGIHSCLGAPLARLEAEVAIGTLVQRLPGLRLGSGTVEWRPNPMLRGPARLPVAYDPDLNTGNDGSRAASCPAQ